MTLRALTVRQPWAQAIVDGHKDVENRSQGFPKGYRGPLLIHAGLQWSERGQYDPRVRPLYLARWPESFALGAVVGVAGVDDIHPAWGCCAPWGEETYPPANPEQRTPGVVTHLRLSDPIALRDPVPARGALGLWTPPRDLRIAVAHALAELVTWDRPGADTVAARGDVEQLWHLVAEDRHTNQG